MKSKDLEQFKLTTHIKERERKWRGEITDVKLYWSNFMQSHTWNMGNISHIEGDGTGKEHF